MHVFLSTIFSISDALVQVLYLIITDILFLSFIQIFETPKDHRKAKPFHDHVFVFSIVDDHIWFRNYQVYIYLVFKECP